MPQRESQMCARSLEGRSILHERSRFHGGYLFRRSGHWDDTFYLIDLGGDKQGGSGETTKRGK